MGDAFVRLVTVIAHEAGHAVAAWASPGCSPPVLICFVPAKGEAACGIDPWPRPDSTTACLELASFFLGGIAGETVAFGGFEALGGTDLDFALAMAKRCRSFTGAPRRRTRLTPFLRQLPLGVFSDLRGFLNQAYDLSISRLETHKDAHGALRAALAKGYARGRLEWDGPRLKKLLGPRP